MMANTVEHIGPRITMDMQTWRGYSAYEIAVQNGFEGSEEEWLASLKGERGDDAATLTVNRKEAVDKNITLFGTDIQVQSGSTRTLAQALENVVTSDVVVDSLDSDDPTKPLSAAAGARLAAAIAGMVRMKTFHVTLPAANWSEDNTQTVDLAGVTTDQLLIITAAPESYEPYNDSVVWCSAQGEGTLTFSAKYTPSEDVAANILMLTQEAEQTPEEPAPDEEEVEGDV